MFKNQVTDGLMVTVTWDLPPSSTEEDVRNLVEEHGSEVTTVRTGPGPHGDQGERGQDDQGV